MAHGDCRMYEAKFPEVDDVVMVQVKSIAEMGAYVSLQEYNNIEGMILLSELSRRRIRSITKLIKACGTLQSTPPPPPGQARRRLVTALRHCNATRPLSSAHVRHRDTCKLTQQVALHHSANMPPDGVGCCRSADRSQ